MRGYPDVRKPIFGCTEEAAIRKLEEDAHSDSEEQASVLPVPLEY